ncbi:MAG: hypothetical protein GY803_15055 [Chloroflexi bacterium]|nr:hypothetical protein [Chloroflexota bacterium]
MSKKGQALLEQFRAHKQDDLALSLQLNRWSSALIEQMVQEMEQRLVDSDIAVEADLDNSFWAEIR